MAKRNLIDPVPIKDIFNKITIEDLDLRGKRVFIRADFNVPLDDNLMVTDDRRSRSPLPTINYAIDEGAKVILSSHFGRPKGKRDPKLSLAPVAKRLQRLLNKEVIFIPDCVGSQVESLVSKMKEGDVVLLENLRYHPEEEQNNEEFARAMAYTFIKAMGYEVGNSLVEEDMLETAQRIRRKLKGMGIKFYLPVDCVIAQGIEKSTETKIIPTLEIPKGWAALDIGPATARLFSEAIQDAKTILWNGGRGGGVEDGG